MVQHIVGVAIVDAIQQGVQRRPGGATIIEFAWTILHFCPVQKLAFFPLFLDFRFECTKNSKHKSLARVLLFVMEFLLICLWPSYWLLSLSLFTIHYSGCNLVTSAKKKTTKMSMSQSWIHTKILERFPAKPILVGVRESPVPYRTLLLLQGGLSTPESIVWVSAG